MVTDTGITRQRRFSRYCKGVNTAASIYFFAVLELTLLFFMKMQSHRSTFINAGDFEFLHRNGINTVRVPVGWWIAYDPNPPAPFIGGTLKALDNAFSWAQ